MKELDSELGKVPTNRLRIVDRETILGLGGSDRMIARRIANGRLVRVQSGVYSVGQPDPSWRAELIAAVEAGGSEAAVSHRSAFALWDLDGLTTSLVEITVPYGHGPTPSGTIVHRTRRSLPITALGGIRVTPIERTLLDCAGLLPSMIIAKGVDTAMRRNDTNPGRLWETLDTQGGRGVRGTGRLTRVLGRLEAVGATDSPAETELLEALRWRDIPDPTLQYEVVTSGDKVYRLDIAWPHRYKAIEVDGLTVHSGPERFEGDLTRQNALLGAGWQLRRFTGRQIRRDINRVCDEIVAFLDQP